jgi:hypothetical protein
MDVSTKIIVQYSFVFRRLCVKNISVDILYVEEILRVLDRMISLLRFAFSIFSFRIRKSRRHANDARNRRHLRGSAACSAPLQLLPSHFFYKVSRQSTVDCNQRYFQRSGW